MTLYVAGYIILCVIVGVYGSDRDFGFYGFFIASLVFSPLIVFSVLLLSKGSAKKKSAST